MSHTRVIDADTIEVAGEKVRLSGLDAPELGQPARDARGRRYDAGTLAAEKLTKHLNRKIRDGWNANIRAEGRDKYGRALGMITLMRRGRTEDVGSWLVRNGLAVAEYGEQYRADEAHARRKRTGLWAGEFERPCDYRQRAKGNRQTRYKRKRRSRGIFSMLRLVSRVLR